MPISQSSRRCEKAFGWLNLSVSGYFSLLGVLQKPSDSDHHAINRLLYTLEQRLSPKDVDVILEGLCGGKPCGEELPELPPTRLASCA